LSIRNMWYPSKLARIARVVKDKVICRSVIPTPPLFQEIVELLRVDVYTAWGEVIPLYFKTGSPNIVRSFDGYDRVTEWHWYAIDSSESPTPIDPWREVSGREIMLTFFYGKFENACGETRPLYAFDGNCTGAHEKRWFSYHPSKGEWIHIYTYKIGTLGPQVAYGEWNPYTKKWCGF